MEGRRVGVEVTIFPVRDGAGAVRHVALCFKDVTAELKLRTAAEALERSEEQFRSTFEQAAAGVAHVAPGGRWLNVNQRLCDIVGYTREELLESTFQDITYGPDLDADLDFVRKMLAGELATYSMEKRYIKKDRALIWIDLTVSLVRDECGAPKYFISVVQDISARKQAEEALARSEENLATTLNSIGDAVIATDALGHITRMNPVAGELTGWKLDDARGRHLGEVFRIFNERSGEPVESPVDRVLREGAVVGLANHTVLAARDGTRHAIADSGAPIRDAGGSLRGVVLVFRDQTEERDAERALRESEARKGAILSAALDRGVQRDALGHLPAARRDASRSPLAALRQRSVRTSRWDDSRGWMPGGPSYPVNHGCFCVSVDPTRRFCPSSSSFPHGYLVNTERSEICP